MLPEPGLALDLSRVCGRCGYVIQVDDPLVPGPEGERFCVHCAVEYAQAILLAESRLASPLPNRRQRRAAARRGRRRQRS